mgnify:CR=1 FL=1
MHEYNTSRNFRPSTAKALKGKTMNLGRSAFDYKKSVNAKANMKTEGSLNDTFSVIGN